MAENKLRAFVSEDGSYIIPVSWESYSTVRVSNVANLEEAPKLVQDNMDVIKLGESEYIDGSYKINDEGDEDMMIAAQDFAHIGGSAADITPEDFN